MQRGGGRDVEAGPEPVHPAEEPGEEHELPLLLQRRVLKRLRCQRRARLRDQILQIEHLGGSKTFS